MQSATIRSFDVNKFIGDFKGFYRAMLCRARLCHSMSYVCPSVRQWRSGTM